MAKTKHEKVLDETSEIGIRHERFEEQDGDNVKSHSRFSIDDKDALIIMKRAEFDRMSGDNGHALGGNARRIGSIPIVDFLKMKQDAAYNGKELDRKDIERYFDANPGLRTAPKVSANSTSNLIIKAK